MVEVVEHILVELLEMVDQVVVVLTTILLGVQVADKLVQQLQSAAPITPQGNPGGHGPTSPPAWGSGGGGGAGGAGGDGTPTAGGAGGIGIRLPSTFHDPRQASPPSPWLVLVLK